MIRVSTIFVSVCMAILAISIGVILYAAAGLSGFAASLVSLTALAFLLVYHITTLRMQGRSSADGHIANLSRGTAELANQFGEVARRIASIEARMETLETSTRESVRAAASELQELGDLLQDLTATVALHDDSISADLASRASATASAPVAAAVAKEKAETTAVIVPASSLFTTPAINALVASAIASGRIDLHVQPIVTLPQRKVRYYEALCRLRDDQDETVAASHFINDAAKSGQIVQLDQAVILRAMQVLRRLATRNKDLGIFCNVSAMTLSEPAAFAHCIEFLYENRVHAANFVLEFRQDVIRKLSTLEAEHLAAIAQLGYRFSVDHVTDLDFEPRSLNELGVRFIKVSADLLLAHQPTGKQDIHPSDYPKLLARSGIELIAEKIETEAIAVDLLDFDVRFGQGHLFAAPRALRPEATTAPAAVAQPAAIPAVAKIEQPASNGSLKIARQDIAQVASTLSGNAALVRRVLGPH